MKWYILSKKVNSVGPLFKKWWGGFDLFDWDDFETKLLEKFPNYEFIELEPTRVSNATINQVSITVHRDELDGSDLFLKRDAEDNSKPWFYYCNEISGMSSQVQGDEKFTLDFNLDVEATGLSLVLNSLKDKNIYSHFAQKMMNRAKIKNNVRYFDFNQDNHLNTCYIDNQNIKFDWNTYNIPLANWLSFIQTGSVDGDYDKNIYAQILGDNDKHVFIGIDEKGNSFVQTLTQHTSSGALYTCLINVINLKHITEFSQPLKIPKKKDPTQWAIENASKLFVPMDYNDPSHFGQGGKYNYLLFDGNVLHEDFPDSDKKDKDRETAVMKIVGATPELDGEWTVEFFSDIVVGDNKISADAGIDVNMRIDQEDIVIQHNNQWSMTKGYTYFSINETTNNKNYFFVINTYAQNWSDDGQQYYRIDWKDVDGNYFFEKYISVPENLVINQNHRTITFDITEDTNGSTEPFHFGWVNRGDNVVQSLPSNYSLTQNSGDNFTITVADGTDVLDGCVVIDKKIIHTKIQEKVSIDNNTGRSTVYDGFDDMTVWTSISSSNDTNDNIIGYVQDNNILADYYDSRQSGVGQNLLLKNAWVLIPEHRPRIIDVSDETNSITCLQANFRDMLAYDYVKTNPITFCSSRIHPYILSSARQKYLTSGNEPYSEMIYATKKWNSEDYANYCYQLINEDFYVEHYKKGDKAVQTNCITCMIPCMLLFDSDIPIILGNNQNNFFTPISNLHKFIKKWNQFTDDEQYLLPKNTLDNEPSLLSKNFLSFGIDFTKDGFCRLNTSQIDFFKLQHEDWRIWLNTNVGAYFNYRFNIKDIYNTGFEDAPTFSSGLFVDDTQLRYQSSQYQQWLENNQSQMAETKREIRQQQIMSWVSYGISSLSSVIGMAGGAGAIAKEGISSLAGQVGLMNMTKGGAGIISSGFNTAMENNNKMAQVNAQEGDRRNQANVVHGLNYTSDLFEDFDDRWIFERVANDVSKQIQWQTVAKKGYIVNSWFEFNKYNNRQLFNFIKLTEQCDWTSLTNAIIDGLRDCKLNYSTQIINHFISLFKTGICLHKEDLDYSNAHIEDNTEISLDTVN